MFVVPSVSAIQDFQVLYEKHYGVVLAEPEAEVKLNALLGLLSVARECADACGEAHERGEYPEGFLSVSGLGEVTPRPPLS